MKWNDINKYIDPTIRKKFLKDETNEVDMQKYDDAERNVTAELRLYIPCFNRNSKGLARIWASIFNYTFIADANEKNEKGYSQITNGYEKAMAFLQSDEAKNYCKKQDDDSGLTSSDFMRFGATDTTKF